MAELPAVIGIKRYGLPGLQTLLLSWGQPAYRAKQLLAWLYQQPQPRTAAGDVSVDGPVMEPTAAGDVSVDGPVMEPAAAAAKLPPNQDVWSSCGYEDMTSLPANLRSRLTAEQPLARPVLLQRQLSKDGSRKYLLRLADGCCIETVGIPDGSAAAGARGAAGASTGNTAGADSAPVQNGSPTAPALPGAGATGAGGPDNSPRAPSGRLTVCYSTQVGCGMGCAFCATGQGGLKRSLAPGEMADQLLLVAQDFGCRVTNAVAMGEGEPFANYSALLDALRIINHPQGLGIGARHLTVSSCGLLAGIAAFANEPEQFTLAISLHSAVQNTRDQLMPGLANQPLSALRTALLNYLDKTGRRLTLEVTLIANVNDTTVELAALVDFARNMLCHVNLIALNPSEPKAALMPSPPARCREIAATLAAAGIECSIRRSRGADIAAACGQLKGQGGASSKPA